MAEKNRFQISKELEARRPKCTIKVGCGGGKKSTLFFDCLNLAAFSTQVKSKNVQSGGLPYPGVVEIIEGPVGIQFRTEFGTEVLAENHSLIMYSTESDSSGFERKSGHVHMPIIVVNMIENVVCSFVNARHSRRSITI